MGGWGEPRGPVGGRPVELPTSPWTPLWRLLADELNDEALASHVRATIRYGLRKDPAIRAEVEGWLEEDEESLRYAPGLGWFESGPPPGAYC